MNKLTRNNNRLFDKSAQKGSEIAEKLHEYWAIGVLSQKARPKRFQTVMSGHSEHLSLGVDCECKSDERF
jgi:hypothetical protein